MLISFIIIPTLILQYPLTIRPDTSPVLQSQDRHLILTSCLSQNFRPNRWPQINFTPTRCFALSSWLIVGGTEPVVKMFPGAIRLRQFIQVDVCTAISQAGLVPEFLPIHQTMRSWISQGHGMCMRSRSRKKYCRRCVKALEERPSCDMVRRSCFKRSRMANLTSFGRSKKGSRPKVVVV